MASPHLRTPGTPSLLELCIKAATRDKSCVKAWRQKRRTFEMLPSELAHELFNSLLQSHLLSATLIGLFQSNLQEVNLSGEATVDGEWMAYLGGCRHLRALRATDCKALTNNAIWQLTGLTAMEELDLARCRKISDDAVPHILSFKMLRKLGLAETGLTTKGLLLLPGLSRLVLLDLGGCPVTDADLISFQALGMLEHLDLWGSKVTNMGARCLSSFKTLKYLNLAMTAVTAIPQLNSLLSLNLCNCDVESIYGDGTFSDSLLRELFLSGASLSLKDVISGSNTRNLHLLDLASSRVNDLDAFVHIPKLAILDLRATGLTNELMLKFQGLGDNLRWIDLSYTKIDSEGVGAIAGHAPNVEQLSLNHTPVDDNVFIYLVHFPVLQSLNLGGSKVNGFMTVGSEEFQQISVLSYLEQLQHLRRLDMRYTGVGDAALHGLKNLVQLSHLHIHSNSLSDECLQQLSSFPNLVCLGIGGATITADGLLSYKPPSLLEELDLTDCWLLTEPALLDFCEAHPRIMVWNEKTVPVTSSSKPRFNKKEYGDVVNGGLATSSTRQLLQAKLDMRKSSSKLSVKGRMQATKKAFNNTIGVGVTTKPLIVIDERIKYKKQELLQLRSADMSNFSIPNLRNLKDDLLKISRQNGEVRRKKV